MDNESMQEIKKLRQELEAARSLVSQQNSTINQLLEEIQKLTPRTIFHGMFEMYIEAPTSREAEEKALEMLQGLKDNGMISNYWASEGPDGRPFMMHPHKGEV